MAVTGVLIAQAATLKIAKKRENSIEISSQTKYCTNILMFTIFLCVLRLIYAKDNAPRRTKSN